MSKPFLNFPNIGLVRECVGGGGGAERMDAETDHLAADAGHQTVVPHDIAIDGGRVQRPVQLLRRAIIAYRPEEGTRDIEAMAGHTEIFFNQTLRRGVNRDVADLIAFALDAKVNHAPAALDILYQKSAKLFAPQAVIEQGRQDCPIAGALKRFPWWCIEQVFVPGQHRVRGSIPHCHWRAAV